MSLKTKWHDIGVGSGNIKIFLLRLGAACPANYNPADHYIQLLAGIPGREETTRHTIDTVCTAFAKSELGCKIAAEAENALYHEVRHLNPLQYFRDITEGHKSAVTQDNTVADKAQNRKGNVLQYIRDISKGQKWGGPQSIEKPGDWLSKPKKKGISYSSITTVRYLTTLNNNLRTLTIFKRDFFISRFHDCGSSSVDCAWL